MTNANFKTIKDNISSLHHLPFDEKNSTRLNRENQLNRRISVVLRGLYDIETITIRLEKNILASQNIQKQILLRNEKEDKDAIHEIGQKLRQQEEKISRGKFLDLKSLHIFIKIFLDDYTELIRFIFNWRNIGDRSITKFYKSLKKYNGDDKDIILFKKNYFDHIKKIMTSIVDYRDKDIMHNQQKHKQCLWSVSDMRGNIRQVSVLNTGEERSTLNQNELIHIVFEYIKISINFIKEHFESNKND